jgi:UPF0716 protein FxsA
VLVALLLVVPILEVVVFLQVADRIGGWEALALLLAISILGAWLLKAQGLSVMRRVRGELAARRVPGRPLVDGLLIATAGVLLVVPGFVTSLVGLLLILPPTRVPVREHLIRRWTVRRPSRGVGSVGVWDAATISREVPGERSAPQQFRGDRAIEAGDEPLG